MAKKKRKIKKHYTIAVTSDYSGDKTKYYRCRFNIFRMCVLVTLLVVAIGTCLTIYEFRELELMESKVKTFNEVISEQEQTINTLATEKNELAASNEVLQSMVAQQTIKDEQDAAEAELRHIPSAFPLTGSANIVDPTEYFTQDMDEVTAFYEAILATKAKNEEKETDPYVFFVMSGLSDVVASAEGTVISISDNEDYGRAVKIDHGNGYVSIYMNSGDVKVNVGDEVVRGAIIFVGGNDNNYLYYQITYEGTYIDPMDVMVIEG